MPKKTNESHVKAVVKNLIDEAAKIKPLYTMTPATFGYGESGHPDRLLLLGGVLYGIECKKDVNNSHSRPELKPTKSEAFQKLQLKRLAAAGGVPLIIHKDNLVVLKDLLEEFTGTKLTTKAEV